MVLTFFQFKASLRPLNLEEVTKCDLAIKKKIYCYDYDLMACDALQFHRKAPKFWMILLLPRVQVAEAAATKLHVTLREYVIVIFSIVITSKLLHLCNFM